MNFFAPLVDYRLYFFGFRIFADFQIILAYNTRWIISMIRRMTVRIWNLRDYVIIIHGLNQAKIVNFLLRLVHCTTSGRKKPYKRQKRHNMAHCGNIAPPENIIYIIYSDSESSFLIILNPEHYFYQKWLNFFAVIRNLIWFRITTVQLQLQSADYLNPREK